MNSESNRNAHPAPKRLGPVALGTSLLLMSLLAACGGGGGDDAGDDDTAVLGQMETANKASNGKGGKTTTTSPTTSPITSPTTSPTTTEPTSTPTQVAPAPAPTLVDTSTTSLSDTSMLPGATFACAVGAITCVQISSTSTVSQASVPVTFGQPFRIGHWNPATQGLVAKVGDQVVPVQADEISSHRDGSARFAVLSAQVGSLPAGTTRVLNLFPGSKTSSNPAVPADPDWNIEIEARVYDANNNVTATLVATPQAQLKAQIAQNTARRLHGAVATEYSVVLPMRDKITGAAHPHLSARLHTRLLDGGARIRTDMVMENTRTWTTAPGNLTYDLNVKRHGVAIYSQPRFTHYHHARWHKVLWTGGAEPAHQLRHHMPYFLSTRATWNYDLNVKVPETTLAEQYALLQKRRSEQAALGPMGNVFLMPAFSTTGGRDEIGPHPRWTALFLLSQDARAREILLANSDAAASVPVHYRDEATDQPLDVTRHPTVTVAFGTSKPALPTVVNGATIWSPDTAHQGSFSYIPYLITGDAFHLEETAFWAAWNVASINPSYRETSAGLVNSNQVRAQAWAMRSLAEAAWALPDNHAMKGYFQTRLANNLNWYAQNYVNNSTKSQLGIIHKHGDPARIHPWQNDYVSIAISLMAENGEPQALNVLNWFSRFTVGRFLAEPNGFCTVRAPGSGWVYLDASGQFINNWRDMFATNYAADVGKACSTLSITEGYPAQAMGYAASARAVLGATTNAGIAGASGAYARWKSLTPLMDAKLPMDPTWAIVPRP
jgi:hypothetical protein